MDFRSFLSEYDLYDLRHSGNPFSWRGVRHTHVVTCRLDRVVANSEWAEAFPNGRCQYLRFEGSDHRPIITHFSDDKRRRKGLFRYDRRLNDNLEVKTVIEEAWQETPLSTVQLRIENCRRAIVRWNKIKQKNSQLEIETQKTALEKAMTSSTHDETLINKINAKLKAAYKEEEAFWKQRSRQLWQSFL